MTSLLNLVGQGILGVIIGYLIKYLLDYKNSQKTEYANKKRKVYEELVQALNIFLSNRDNAPEKMIQRSVNEIAHMYATP